MKAFLTRSLTSVGALQLGDADLPEPREGELLIAVAAASVQLADIAFALGQRSPRPDLPFTPGFEAAGIVAKVGPGVTVFRKGDTVAAFVPSGGLAEFVCAKAALAVALPESVTPVVAACLPHGHASALAALRDRAGLQAGEILLVLGAGGRSGLAAVEVGKQLGARVIAVANSSERQDTAKEHGADDVIDPGQKAVADQVFNLTGGLRANVIFDPVGGDAALAAYPAGANGMRYVMAGFAGGSASRVDATQFFARDATLISVNGIVMAEREPERLRQALADVVAWAAEGKIKPRIAAKFALKDAGPAFDYVQQRRGAGAVIVTMG